MYIKSIKQANNLAGKRVIVRNDFNVPIKNGKVMDDYRIAAQLETIRYLLREKAKVIMISHLGQPKDKSDHKKLTLQPVRERLEKYLDIPVPLVGDLLGFGAETAVAKLKPGQAILFENIRFYDEEISADKGFARKIAKYGDLYVNDSFGADHRDQATVSTIQDYIESFAGLLLEKEIRNLDLAKRPKRPAVAIFGGVKLKTKLPLVKAYLKRADHVLLGGALANNFLAARGFETGKSLVEKEGVELARAIKSDRIVFPEDVVVSSNKNGGGAQAKKISRVEKGDYIFDIGPDTIKLYSRLIKSANALIWNGPMGFFELNDFRYGTLAVARLVAARSRGQAFGVVGGGETVEALKMSKMLDQVDWVSTGGGAMLTYLADEAMPGLKNIIRK